MKEYIGVTLVGIGWVLIALAFLTGIGFGLYAWGVAGATLGAAAWTGFATWLKCIIGGAVSLIMGFVLVCLEDK